MADDESDTETKFVLQNAAIIGEFYSALRDLKLPDVLIFELVADYHPPTECSRCGEPFTEDNPAKGGFLWEWFCARCCH